MNAVRMGILLIGLVAMPIAGQLVFTAPAQAQNNERFQSLVQRGVSAYKSGQYRAAAKAFREAYQIKPEPTLLFNIGRSLEQVGALDDALNHYQAYVDAPGTTTEGRASALSKIQALRKEKEARAALKKNGAKAPPLPPLGGDRTPPPPPPPPTVAPPPPASPPPPAAKPVDLVVLVNAANKEASLTFSSLRDIYMGRRSTWTNGERIRPFGRPRTTRAARAFFKKLSNLSATQYARHWQRQQLSGAGMAPANVSAKSVLKAIRINKGAVGYAIRKELPKELPPTVRIIVPR